MTDRTLDSISSQYANACLPSFDISCNIRMFNTEAVLLCLISGAVVPRWDIRQKAETLVSHGGDTGVTRGAWMPWNKVWKSNASHLTSENAAWGWGKHVSAKTEEFFQKLRTAFESAIKIVSPPPSYLKLKQISSLRRCQSKSPKVARHCFSANSSGGAT